MSSLWFQLHRNTFHPLHCHSHLNHHISNLVSCNPICDLVSVGNHTNPQSNRLDYKPSAFPVWVLQVLQEMNTFRLNIGTYPLQLHCNLRTDKPAVVAVTPQSFSSSPFSSQSSVPSQIQSGFTQSLVLDNGHWHHSEVQQLPWLQAICAKALFPKMPKRAMTKMGRPMTTFFAVPMSGDWRTAPLGTLVVRGVSLQLVLSSTCLYSRSKS